MMFENRRSLVLGGVTKKRRLIRLHGAIAPPAKPREKHELYQAHDALRPNQDAPLIAAFSASQMFRAKRPELEVMLASNRLQPENGLGAIHTACSTLWAVDRPDSFEWPVTELLKW